MHYNHSGVISLRVVLILQFPLAVNLGEETLVDNKFQTYLFVKMAESPANALPLKRQLKRIQIELDPDNTMCRIQPKVVLVMSVASVCLAILSATVNAMYTKWIVFDLITGTCLLMTVMTYFCKCNLFIIKKACWSFVIWYKLVYTLIGMIARELYINFWIVNNEDAGFVYSDFPTVSLGDDEKNSQNKTLVYGLYYFAGTLRILCAFMSVLTLSCFDGIKSETYILKKLATIVVLGTFLTLWISLFFGLHYTDDPFVSFQIDGRLYYWRNVALSSIGTVIIFVCSQFYQQIKYPSKLKVLTLPIIINICCVNDNDDCNDDDNIKSDNANEFTNNSNFAKQFNSPISIEVEELRRKNDQIEILYDDVDNKHDNCNTETEDLKQNCNHDCKDMDTDSDIDSHAHSASRKDDEENKKEVLSTMQSMMMDENEEMFLSAEEYELIFAKDINMHNSNNNNHYMNSNINNNNTWVFGKNRINMMDKEAQISVNVNKEFTLFYVILRQIFKIDYQTRLYLSRMIFSKRKMMIYAFGCTTRIMASILSNWTGTIVLLNSITDAILFICGTLIFVNINYALIQFKGSTFLVLWKVFNVIKMHAALYCLRYKFNLSIYDSHYYPIGISIYITVQSICYMIMAVYGISLAPGYLISKKVKTVVCCAIIWNFSGIAIYHYMNQDIEVTFDVIGSIFGGNNNNGNKISCRDVVISTGYDLIIWLLHQEYQNVAHPYVIRLSKLEIVWSSNQDGD